MNQHSESLPQPKPSTCARSAGGSPRGGWAAPATPPWQSLQRGAKAWPPLLAVTPSPALESEAPLCLQAHLSSIGITLAALGSPGVINWETPYFAQDFLPSQAPWLPALRVLCKGCRHPAGPLAPQICFPAAQAYSLHVDEAHHVSITDSCPKVLRQRYIALILLIYKTGNRGRTQNIVSKITLHASNGTAIMSDTSHKHGVDADADTKAPLAAFSLQQETNFFAQSWLSLHLE